MKPLTPRERKLVAIGLLVAALALSWLGLVQPLISGFSERAERREALREQYAHNERLIARIAVLRRAAEAQNRSRGDFAIAAPDAGLAAEILRERLEASLAKVGGELRASDSIEAQPGWVQAKTSAVVSNDQLLAWLELLSRDKPFLAMESLTVSADRAINTNRLDLMDVTLEAAIPFSPANAR